MSTRLRYTLRTALVCGALLAGSAPSHAEEHEVPAATPMDVAVDSAVVRIDPAHVESALEQAGAHRAELQRVLDHYRSDPLKHTAAQFLIANMPGHGYIRTTLQDAQGKTIAFDPLVYRNFKAALAALDQIEKQHGAVEFKRDDKVEDLKTIRAAFLIRHIDLSFEAWRASPATRRVAFQTFLDFVLPYRGSQEPLDNWLEPLMRRWPDAERRPKIKGDVKALYRYLCKQSSQRVRFDERFYLHPTDQGFTEMGRSGLGRCEDITNMQTFAARSLALATAADYTPAWAHRDNNHAWNVLLDKRGHGFAKAQSHAAKVYRKTFALQRDNLAFQLPDGAQAPNRFMASRTYMDVTTQYMDTTDVRVEVDSQHAAEQFAYLCVFNGGAWTAIHWGRINAGVVTFDAMGRNIVYLPAVHIDGALVPIAAPLLALNDGSVQQLTGKGSATKLWADGTRPAQKHSDTLEVAPASRLRAGKTYTLKRWANGWVDLRTFVADAYPVMFDTLATGALYWLVEKDSRQLERVFTIQNTRQRWW